MKVAKASMYTRSLDQKRSVQFRIEVVNKIFKICPYIQTSIKLQRVTLKGLPSQGLAVNFPKALQALQESVMRLRGEELFIYPRGKEGMQRSDNNDTSTPPAASPNNNNTPEMTLPPHPLSKLIEWKEQFKKTSDPQERIALQIRINRIQTVEKKLIYVLIGQKQKENQMSVYQELGSTYRSLGEFEQALVCHNKVLSLAIEVKHRQGEGVAYSGLGNTYFSLGSYTEAIRCYERHLGVAEELRDREGEGVAYGGLGLACGSLGSYEKAIGYHEKHLEIAKELGDRGGEGAAYSGLGNAHYSQGSYEKAISYHENCLAIAKELGEQGGEGGAYGDLGNAYYSLGSYEKAISYHEKDLAIAKELGDRGGEGAAYSGLGNAHYSQGSYKKAISYHEKDLAIAKELGDRGGEGAAYSGLGNGYTSLGFYEKAISYHKKHLAIAQELDDRGGEGGAYGNLGLAYDSTGSYKKAIIYHEQYLRIAQALRDREREGKAYGNLGNTHRSLGLYKKAISYHEKHLAIAQKLKDRRGEGKAYGNLGNAYFSLGSYTKAIGYHKKCLVIAKELGSRGGKEVAYSGLGNAYQALGLYAEAISYHNKHLLIAKELEDRGGEGRAYCNLGNAYISLGLYKKAIDYYNQYLFIAKALGDQKGKGEGYGGLGNVYFSLGLYDQAISSHKKCLAIAEETGNRTGTGQARNNLGSAYRLSNRLPEAQKEFEKAISTYSALQKDLGSENTQWKITIFEEQARSYRNLEEVYLLQGNSQKALAIADYGRSRALVDQLGEKLGLKSHAPLSLEEIQKTARLSNTTLIVYSCSMFKKDKAWAWVVSPTGEISHEELSTADLLSHKDFKATIPDFMRGKPAAEQLKELSTNWVRSFESVRKEEDPNNNNLGKSEVLSEEEATPSNSELMKLWYQALIKPLEKFLPKEKGSRVTIVQDEFLHELPFAIFQDNDGKYLIEKYTLSTTPSIEALRRVAELDRVNTPKRKKDQVTIIGEPSGHSPLPASIDEAEDVAWMLGASGQELTGDDATPDKVKKTMVSASKIHLACHGDATARTNIHSVFEGALKLAEGDLHAEEIANMSLNADLAFLSACKSGKGQLRKEGVVGLTLAFLAGGVSSIVATHWNISDEGTQAIVSEFYEHITGKSDKAKERKDPFDKTEALREAMLTSIRSNSDPSIWGAFFLVGLF